MKNKLPNFLIVGAAKCGTSSLHNYLNQHPNVDVCVISGRSKLELQEWFGHLPVHLIAEHGFHFRLSGESWMTPFQYVDLDWKEDVYKAI